MSLRKVFLLGICLILSQAAMAFITPGTYPTLTDIKGSIQYKPRTFSEEVELRSIQYYSLAEIYEYQKNYVEEDFINFDSYTYIVEYTADSAFDYLQVPYADIDFSTTQAREQYLRTISGSMLGLLLYRLGGDGTDHSCQSWLAKQLPRSTLEVNRSSSWYASYSGVMMDLSGQCREAGVTPAIYVSIQVVYNPFTQTGEVFLGVERLNKHPALRLDSPFAD